MDKEALYWVLSTLPQVSAALVAFIGFLALQSLDEPSRRCAQLEDSCRTYIQDINRNVPIGKFGELTWFEIDALSPEVLMENVGTFLETPNPAAMQGAPDMEKMLSTYYREWERLDSQTRKTRKALAVFVVFHLLVIGVSLSLIPYIPYLATASWTAVATIATSILMVVTVGIMIFVALKGSANYRTQNPKKWRQSR